MMPPRGHHRANYQRELRDRRDYIKTLKREGDRLMHLRGFIHKPPLTMHTVQ